VTLGPNVLAPGSSCEGLRPCWARFDSQLGAGGSDPTYPLRLPALILTKLSTYRGKPRHLHPSRGTTRFPSMCSSSTGRCRILGSPGDLLPTAALAPLGRRAGRDELFQGLGQFGSMVYPPLLGCVPVVPGVTSRNEQNRTLGANPVGLKSRNRLTARQKKLNTALF
jgi:hypothetical protein